MAERNFNRTDFAEFSTDLLRQGVKIRFRARGRSMAPLIRDGDVLTVEPATSDGLRVGDVALHRIGGRQVVAHRVVGRHEEDGRPVLTTRGDASFNAPDPVREGDVLGRVVQVERDGRVVCIHRGLVARFRRAVRRLAARLLRRA